MNQYCDIKVKCSLCKPRSDVGDLKYSSEHSLAEQYTKLSHQLQAPAALYAKTKAAIVLEKARMCVIHSQLVPLRWWRKLLAL